MMTPILSPTLSEEKKKGGGGYGIANAMTQQSLDRFPLNQVSSLEPSWPVDVQRHDHLPIATTWAW